ncbi:hypothetical protein [Spartinivicinus poritis]|uniref:Uncharacterized protein n=1 Tax=Spartinivicinus poritis TaxID=2994640 RepID=A0ABT5UGL2_9GAMM|nr:hypothetical protein [Spartinivicinus sp. A2-2]MDE1465516.1 hypothetical protein [Spartinivicinus sp. A2-2]
MPETYYVGLESFSEEDALYLSSENIFIHYKDILEGLLKPHEVEFLYWPLEPAYSLIDGEKADDYKPIFKDPHKLLIITHKIKDCLKKKEGEFINSKTGNYYHEDLQEHLDNIIKLCKKAKKHGVRLKLYAYY